MWRGVSGDPYGLHFLPDGRLLALDLGINDRGNRPVGEAPSCLYEIKAGSWYGWPDFAAGVPVTHPDLLPARGTVPRFLLTNHDELGVPEQPLYRFEPRTAPTRMAYVSESDELIVTLFGDRRPVTGPEGPRVGRRLIRDAPVRPVLDRFEGLALHRPIDVAYRLVSERFTSWTSANSKSVVRGSPSSGPNGLAVAASVRPR